MFSNEISCKYHQCGNNRQQAAPCVPHCQTPEPPLERKEPRVEAVVRRDDKDQPRAKTTLVRSKSVGSLQGSAVSIRDLRSLFETTAEAATQNELKVSLRARNPSSSSKETINTKVMTQEVEEVKRPSEEPKTKVPATLPATRVKDDQVSEKVNKHHFSLSQSNYPRAEFSFAAVY